MNSRDNLFARLLDAFPVSILKEVFNEDGLKSVIIKSILDKNTDDKIKKFVCKYFNLLHLQIGVYEVNRKILSTTTDMMDGECLEFKNSARISEWIYLHKTAVRYYDTQTDSSETIEFLIPVKITNKDKVLIIYHNTFGQDIPSYFDYTIYLDRKGNLEQDIMRNIENKYNKSIFKLDLNKGIKYLWKNDYIDAMHFRNRNSRSMRQERMDENYLYKSCYFDEWKKLMDTPIQKTKFKSLKKDIPVEHFDCNPSTGFIGVSIHTASTNHVSKLIKIILNNNN